MFVHPEAAPGFVTDFSFTTDERAESMDVLNSCQVSPYEDYKEFGRMIAVLAGELPVRFREFVGRASLRDLAKRPVMVVTNCPIDDSLPVFGNEDPRGDKLSTKQSFIAEGFLAAYAILSKTENIAHLTVNDGDFFHDIYPKTSMFDLQSAKTLKTLRFHKDFPTHFVTPDFINTFTMRGTPNNEVYSTFAVNKEALGELDAGDIGMLLEPRFMTPVDDSSGSSKLKIIQPAGNHPIIDPDELGLKVFEGRTQGTDPESEIVFGRLIDALHKVKRSRVSQPGDMVSFCNRYVIHGREVVSIGDPDELARRWLIKAHTVFSLADYEGHFLEGRYGVVNG
jgi:L-asparagine oxygenase